ncbi:MAG: lasso peptide biosynthesis B2 protein, partial [Acidimicrobiia bacterium]|nr:lasso peptide biosynthesis B2 protein [Acidimicrobiia bacterium]
MLRLPSRVRRLLDLSWAERLAFAEATALWWFFTIGLKVIPFRRFRRILGSAGPNDERPPRRPGRPVETEARTVARSIGRIARNHPDSCLAQALAARVMMRRRELPSRISLGTLRGDDGEVKFHAWLDHDAWVITGGGQLPSFSVIATYD